MTRQHSKIIHLATVTLMAVVFWALWGTTPARADSPVFVRPAGSDTYCVGIANVDFSPGVVPACAVQTVHRAVKLAGPNGTVILETSSGPVTIPLYEFSLPSTGDLPLVATAITTLTVTKTDFPDPVQVNNPLTYTVRIENVGPQPANPVSLLDVLPGVDVVTQTKATPSQGSCSVFVSPTTQRWLVDCNLLQLNSGAAATVTVVVTPTAAGIIQNVADASSDPSVQGGSDVESTRVQGVNDLAIIKTDFPDPVYVGQPLTYTLTLSNTGPTAAASVVVRDTLPGTVGFGSASPNCNHVAGVVTCTAAFLGVNQTIVYTIQVTPTGVGVITNTASITGGDQDPISANNVVTISTTVNNAVNLGLTKTDSPDPVVAGNSLTYTLVVSNSGPGTASNVTLTDNLPVQVAVNNASGNALLLHLNEPASAITFTDSSGNGYNGSCTNCPTAGVSGKFGSALSFNGTDDFVNLGNPAGLNFAGNVTLMAWVNISDTTGTRDIIAHGYTTTPDAAVFLRIDSGNYQVGSWNGANHLTSVAIPGGDVGTWVHLAGVYDGSTWRLYRNGVQVSATADATGAVTVNENWAIGAKGTGTERFFSGKIDEAAIFNRGLSALEIAAIYQNQLSGQVITSQGACVAGASVSCNLGSLANLGAATVTMRVMVTPTASGIITNTAAVTAAEFDSNTTNNTAVATTTVTPPVTFAIAKTATPLPGSSIQAGSRITYTLYLTNTGGVTATNVRLIDPLDPNVTVVYSNTIPTGVITGSNPIEARWTSLAPGAGVRFIIGVQTSSLLTVGAIISNAAQGLSAEVVTPVSTTPITHIIGSLAPPNFTLVKTANPPSGTPVNPGDTITYTVVVQNIGGPVSGTTYLTDTIPANTAYVSGSAARTPNLGGIGPSSNAVVMTVPNFPAGLTMTATFRVTVTTNFTLTISNQARLASTQTALQNSNTVTHPVRGTAINSGMVYLPVILKNYASAGIVSFYWNGLEPVRDKVTFADGAAGLVTDTRPDGVFRLAINMGSQTKTVNSLRLDSSQGPTVYWDTVNGNGSWVLGIFNGGILLNNPVNGTINQTVSGMFEVNLYASNTITPSLFPPDTYDYTVTVGFTDGSSLQATTRIPPVAPPTPVPTPPTPAPGCVPEVLANVTVGNSPRGIAVDTNRSNRVYVANFGSSSVSVIQNNAVITTITGVNTANGIAYDPTNDLIWVTNYSANTVTPINASTFAKLPAVSVGNGPWGVAHNTSNNTVYVVNRDGNSVTAINATTRAVIGTITGSFNQPHHIAVNPVNGKVYVSNLGNNSVTVISGTSVNKVVSLFDSTQPYGITVDETRNLVYVATVDSHRVVAIGEFGGVQDEFLGWAAFYRGENPARPVPLRVIAINPEMGPSGDGGHLWTTTTTNDGSEANQVLLIPKGWSSYFHRPVARNVGANPAEGIAVDRAADRVYVSSGASPGGVTVLRDGSDVCLEPFDLDDGFGFDLFVREK